MSARILWDDPSSPPPTLTFFGFAPHKNKSAIRLIGTTGNIFIFLLLLFICKHTYYIISTNKRWFLISKHSADRKQQPISLSRCDEAVCHRTRAVSLDQGPLLQWSDSLPANSLKSPFNSFNTCCVSGLSYLGPPPATSTAPPLPLLLSTSWCFLRRPSDRPTATRADLQPRARITPCHGTRAPAGRAIATSARAPQDPGQCK